MQFVGRIEVAGEIKTRDGKRTRGVLLEMPEEDTRRIARLAFGKRMTFRLVSTMEERLHLDTAKEGLPALAGDGTQRVTRVFNEEGVYILSMLTRLVRDLSEQASTWPDSGSV